jgi:hypothetical protein
MKLNARYGKLKHASGIYRKNKGEKAVSAGSKSMGTGVNKVGSGVTERMRITFFGFENKTE